MDLYNIPELQRKAELGKQLTEEEASALQEHCTFKARHKLSFDFAELEGRLGSGLESQHLLARNRRWVKMGPKRPAPGPYPYDNSPAFTGPYLTDGPGGTERMLKRFFAKLEEVRETGKV